MGGFSLWHWLVVIILIMLLFGRGKISDLMGDFGKGLKSFKEGMADDEQTRRPAEPPRVTDNRPIDVTPEPRRADDPVVQPRDDSTPQA